MSSKLVESDTSSSGDTKSQSYDVFISYKDDDTAAMFTNHLCKTLDHNGVAAFKDHQERDATAGRTDKSPKLQQAIQDSRISFVVLSPNYAASSSCLDELVYVLECSSKYGNKVFPIFYGMLPSEVLYRTYRLGQAFGENNIEKVQSWRSALTEVANLFGFEVNNR